LFSKKGAGYVDWIISMSFFLITVLMIFAFLRPGVAPNFESEDLLNIVESKFFENVSWESLSVPATVTLNNDAYLEIKQQSSTVSSEWDFVSYYSPQDLIALNIEFNIDTSNNKFTVQCTAGITDCTTIDPNNLPQGKNFTGVYLISMEKPTASENKVFDIELVCYPLSSTDCHVLIGSEERFRGLNQNRISSLAVHTYEQIKTDWAFPQTRDFSITIEDPAGIVEIKPNYLPPEQANVFVRELLTPILNGDGSRTQIKTRIRVW
jgi:hypothetical protein